MIWYVGKCGRCKKDIVKRYCNNGHIQPWRKVLTDVCSCLPMGSDLHKLIKNGQELVIWDEKKI